MAITDFEGRVAVVTGGASGIGKGLAKAFLAEGAHAVIADVERGPLEATAAEIGAAGVVCDVSDFDSVVALADEVMRRFGRVDILCNNAGVAPKVKVAEASIDDWRWVIDVNLWGVIHGVKAFMPHLLANPEGAHIVNTASAGGLVTGPMIGPYSATKAGVVALSEALKMELTMDQAKVGVTLFCPGTVRTNLHTSSRNRPAKLGDAKAIDIDLMKNPSLIGEQRWLTGDEVAPAVIDAIRRGAHYVTSHPEIAEGVESRLRNIMAAFREWS